MKKATTFFMFILLSYGAQAQQVFTQYTYWLRYHNQLIFSPSLQWNNEIDNRRFFDPDVALQFIIHSRLHYKWKHWDFGGGVSYSLAFAQKNEEGYDHANAEIRPVIEAQHEWKTKTILIQNRFRVDNRFIQTDPDQNVFEESMYVMRYRYRFQIKLPLQSSEDNTGLSLRIADEIMFNNKKNTFDQNRIYATLEIPISRKFTGEAGYIYIYQQRFGRDEFFERHVLRLSVLHRIWLK